MRITQDLDFQRQFRIDLESRSRSRSWPGVFILFFISSCLPVIISGEFKGVCHPQWIESHHSGTCIKLNYGLSTWDKARARCRADDADLVKIVNSDMDEFINGILKENWNKFWIGLKRDNLEDTFKWLDEEATPTFLNWNQSSSSSPGRECAYVYFGKDWEHTSCDNELKFLCETDAACSNRKFGMNCSIDCSPYCAGASKACHKKNGTCLEGCISGVGGRRCTTIPVEENNEDNTIMIVLGVIFAGVIIACFTMLVALINFGNGRPTPEDNATKVFGAGVESATSIDAHAIFFKKSNTYSTNIF